MSINIEKLLNPVGQGKTYLYCDDRLSLGVLEILKSLNHKVDGILYEEFIENDTVVICHDKHSVFTSKQKRLESLQKGRIRVMRFTTEDLVGDLPFGKLFKQNF